MKFPRLTSEYGKRQRMVSLGIGAFIGLILCAVQWQVWPGQLPLLSILDSKALDVYQKQFIDRRDEGQILEESVTRRLVLVVVDDQSLAQGLTWPLPRSTYLDLVQRLEKAGAKTIGLDILFGAQGPDPEADLKLKEALAHPSVVLAYTTNNVEGELAQAGVYPPLLEGWSKEDRERRLGFTLEHPDFDKVVRRAVVDLDPIQVRSDFPDPPPQYSFDVAVLAHFLDLPPAEVVSRIKGLEEMGLTIEGLPAKSRMGTIGYFGTDVSAKAELIPSREDEYQEGEIRVIEGAAVHKQIGIDTELLVVPVFEILNAAEEDLPRFLHYEEDPKTGEARPVETMALVGVTVSGGHDLKVCPLGGISGVGIHANILANILQDNFLRPSPLVPSLILILATAFLAAVIGATLEPRVATLTFLLAAGAGFYVGMERYIANYLDGAPMPPLGMLALTAVLSYSAVTVYNVIAQKAAKDKFAKILQEVAPIPDLEALLGKDGLKVGSEERNLTILFSDIRGYTDLSESLDPVTVTEMLNAYHQAMGEVFDRYGGIIFDYQGDAQMVVFGLVPASQPNHAAAACKAGAGMVLRLEKLRQEWQAQGRPVFETGVGVCTGPVAIGVLGSAQRKQYAAIGDATNTAARMQGKSKDLDSPVLITQSTYDEAGDEIIADFIEAVRVKGKREPLNVYGVRIQEMESKMGVRA